MPPVKSASFLDLPQELHDMIFGYLKLRNLARLALASKACYKSVNPSIWRNVAGINTLLELMPVDVWNGMKVEDYGKLDDLPLDRLPLTVDHWKPVYKLSSLIKNFWLHDIPCTVLRRVIDCPPAATLLPSLRRLRIFLDYTQRQRLFTGSRQSSLYLDYIKLFKATIPSDLQELDLWNSLALGDILDHCTQISRLSIMEFRDGPAFYSLHEHARDSLLQCLPRCQQLTEVTLVLPFPRHSKVLEILATFPNLSSVHVSFTFSTQMPWSGGPPRYPRHAFPALSRLVLEYVTLEDAKDVIETGKDRALGKLAVRTLGRETPETLHTLVTALERHCNTDHLLAVDFVRWGCDASDLGEPQPVLFDHVAPLANFPHVEVARFRAFRGVRIAEEQWEHWAKSWPKLRRYSWRTVNVDAAAHPSCSLATLSSFAKFCPNIEEMRLQIDASTIPPSPSLPPRETLANRRVAITFAAPCEISCAEDVVEFLRQTFGDVTVHLGYQDRGMTTGNQELCRRECQWELVRALTSGKR
ncbi:hypothetical protein K525DRAFT_208655 [Schizophyllum commune Loenen D]|nr:hypothetical protein K525DRAFT_208655 [Schizophyllum commune Loenen D]